MHFPGGLFWFCVSSSLKKRLPTKCKSPPPFVLIFAQLELKKRLPTKNTLFLQPKVVMSEFTYSLFCHYKSLPHSPTWGNWFPHGLGHQGLGQHRKLPFGILSSVCKLLLWDWTGSNLPVYSSTRHYHKHTLGRDSRSLSHTCLVERIMKIKITNLCQGARTRFCTAIFQHAQAQICF